MRRDFSHEIGYKYRKSTEHLQRQMKPHEMELWEAVGALVQEYEDHSSVEKIVEEKKEA